MSPLEGISAGSTHWADSPATLTAGAGHGPVPGLPVHFRQPGVHQKPGVDSRRDERGNHPPDPVAFPCRRGGVDDLLHVPGLDVLAGDLPDHRDRVQHAQPALAMRVLARPPLGNREPVRGQVVGDEGGARLPHLRGIGFQPDLDLFQLGGQIVLGRRLALLPLAVFVPDRPPEASLGAGRVDRDAALQLDDLAVAAGSRAALPARQDRAPARLGGLLRPP